MNKTVGWCCFASSFAVLLAVFLFRRQWSITALSAVPLFLAVLSVFLVYHFRDSAGQSEQTAYGSALTEQEQRTLSRYTSLAFAILAPWQGIFVFFFPTAVKFVSVAVFLAGYAAGPLAFRLRHGKELLLRREQEQRELEAQIKKEEHGKWK